ncbi:MAG: hypothetical protein JO337_12845 [Acidimicrobiales bacterium]|nr:hypothetical protein [Acidimicrobiales bacterium]
MTPDELERLNAYWRAANYISVGQIYLLDNPLLRQPLRPEHVKPRLLGHWGTTPGLNFLYAHLNRVIRNWDLNMMYVIGPGHGGGPVGGHHHGVHPPRGVGHGDPVRQCRPGPGLVARGARRNATCRARLHPRTPFRPVGPGR